MKKAQTGVSLPQDIEDWIKAEAAQLRCSTAQVIRTILAQEMKRRKEAK